MPTATAKGPAVIERLCELAPVGLADLNDGAALLTRTDRKYVMLESGVSDLVDGLGESIRILEIDGRRESGHRSTYFDTPDRQSYALAAYGRRRRFKVRTWVYTDTAEGWLEVKTRGPRGVTIKERIRYRHVVHGGLTHEGATFVQGCLAAASITGVDVHRLAPTLMTGYRRSTLLLVDGGVRVTLDRDLSWSLPAGGVLGAPHLMIVETKSGAKGSGDADRALWALGHRPMRISKFGTGLCLFYPHLPSNRWQRVVRRHLDHLATCSHDKEVF